LNHLTRMAYHPNGNFNLHVTASYLPSNLSCLGNQLTVVKFNEVYISNYGSGEFTRVTLNTKTSIFQAALVTVNEESYLVIASSDGTHVYPSGGSEMLFFLPIGVSTGEDSNDPAFACGITSTGEEGFIFTGSSNGNITAIQLARSGDGFNFHSTLTTSNCPIMALAASPEIIASGNDNGDIFGFSATSGTKFARKCKFNGSGSPCTTICALNSTIYAGFSLGIIRVYNVERSELTIEVTAHARCIYGLALHPSMPIIASCSEDQHLHFWSAENMDLLSSHVVENRRLTGVAFLPHSEVGVSAYDCDEVSVFIAD